MIWLVIGALVLLVLVGGFAVQQRRTVGRTVEDDTWKESNAAAWAETWRDHG